jgi:RNA polymerase sigma-70 factor (ECF subfamily)
MRGDPVSVSEKDIFENTYITYGRKLYHFCLVQLRNASDAEDAVQEVFIKRLYNAPDFSCEDHERNWIYRVAINICRDKLRQKRRLDLPIDCAEDMSHEQARPLLGAVMEMPEKLRLAIHLHYYEGYSVKEISKMLCTTESAVKMRLKRGRELLRGELEDEA